MDFDIIRSMLAALPEVNDWPELAEVFDRAGHVPRPDWELPLKASVAVGGNRAAALRGAAAIACMQISIILVDDILDHDPRGEYLRRGFGETANLAIAFQALSNRLIEASDIRPKIQAACLAILAKIALATAVGQQLDIQNLQSEEDYWFVVRAKSTPFYGGALQLGAVLGGGDSQQGQVLYDLGVLIGELIQIEDDLSDAFQLPANPDWTEGRNNLLILYARTADHPQKHEFEALLPHTSNVSVLKEAHRMLVASGAVSYTAYLLIHKYQQAQKILIRADLPNPTPLIEILDEYAETIIARLRNCGVVINKKQLMGAHS